MTQAPGWYSDPQDPSRNLYWDGRTWHRNGAPPTTAPSSAPPQKPPKKKGFGKKVLGAVVGLVVFLGLVSMCAGSNDEKSGGSGSSASQGIDKPDATFTTAEDTDGQVVTAQFAIHDNFTDGMRKDGARIDTVAILKYVKATYPNVAEVNVKGTFPMVDGYGNTSTDVVVNLTYSRATLNKINFENVSFDRIWEIADTSYVQQEFRP